jgi:hypothetical protein
MGTTSIEVFKARHFDTPKTDLKPALQSLSMTQLKLLAKKHGIQIKGKVVENLFDSYRKQPTKAQYVNRLVKTVTAKEISSLPQEVVKPKKRSKPKDDNYFW